MADDKYDGSSQERIMAEKKEWEEQEDNSIAQKKRTEQNEKTQRNIKRERKQENERVEEARRTRAIAEEKAKQQKAQKDQTRKDMEQIRETEKKNKRGAEKTTKGVPITDNRSIENLNVKEIEHNEHASASTNGTENSSRNSNIEQELYQDGKKISETDLPENIRKDIQKVREKLKNKQNNVDGAREGSFGGGEDSSSEATSGADALEIVNAIKNGGSSFKLNMSKSNSTKIGTSGKKIGGSSGSNGASSSNLGGKSPANNDKLNLGSSAGENENNAPETSSQEEQNKGKNANGLGALGGLGAADKIRNDLKNNAKNNGGKNNGATDNGATDNEGKQEDSSSDTGGENDLGQTPNAGMGKMNANNLINMASKANSVRQGMKEAVNNPTTLGSKMKMGSGTRAGASSAGATAGGGSAGAANGAKAAGGLGKGLMKAKKIGTFIAMTPLGWFIMMGFIIVVVIILLIGIASFIMNMPNAVRDKVIEFGDTLWHKCQGLLYGQDKPSKNQVKQLATYLEKMGYDLNYYGFTTKLEKDKKGNITDLESKYLMAYLAADQRSYMIANENANVKEWWSGITNVDKWGEVWGTGMIVLDDNTVREVVKDRNPFTALGKLTSSTATSIMRYFSGEKNLTDLLKRVVILRETKEMYISRLDIDLAHFNAGYDVYRYSLKQWTEKYGTPTELFLTLHLATMAPEFAYDIATTKDTKVFINTHNLDNVELELVTAKSDKNNKIILGEDGKPIMIPISEANFKDLAPSVREKINNFGKQNINIYTPYITKVENHWYYKEIVYQGIPGSGKYEGKKIDVYKEEKLEEGTPGYVRYYAYTQLQNGDSAKIEEETKPAIPGLDLSGFGGLGGLVGGLLGSGGFLGGLGGISGILDGAGFDGLINGGFDKLSAGMLGQIPTDLLDGLSEDWLYGFKRFVKDGINIDMPNFDGINLGNMKDLLDFGDIVNNMNLGISGDILNTDDLLNALNKNDFGKLMDLSDLTDIADLDKKLNGLDLMNLEDVLNKENIGGILNFDKMNFEDITGTMLEGFSPERLSELDAVVLQLADEVFSGVSPEDYPMLSERVIRDLSKKVVDATSGDLLDGISGELERHISRQYDNQMLYGLSNEYARQLTGLTIYQLEDFAEMNDIDSQTVSRVSRQVNDVESALRAYKNNMQNLSNSNNKISKSMTGNDAKMLNNLLNQVRTVDIETANLKSDIGLLNDIIKSKNFSQTNKSQYETVLNNFSYEMLTFEKAIKELRPESIYASKERLNEYKNELMKMANNLKDVDEATLSKIKNQVSRIEKQTNNFAKAIDNLDRDSIDRVNLNWYGINKNTLLDFASKVKDLEPYMNDINNVVDSFEKDMKELNTNNLKSYIDKLKNYDRITRQASENIEGLLREEYNELNLQVSKLSNSLNQLDRALNNLDIYALNLINEGVDGLNSPLLIIFGGQILGLNNTLIRDLLREINYLPSRLLDDLRDDINKKINLGLREGLSRNLSTKLSTKLSGSLNSGGRLKAGMTGGESGKNDPLTSDESTEQGEPEYLTGIFVKEIRHSDYMQKAEPIRIPYDSTYWYKLLKEKKYVILEDAKIDRTKLADPTYIEQYGKTIWQATNGQLSTLIYGQLEALDSVESEYLLRYFKELFTEFGFVLEADYNPNGGTVPGTEAKKDTFGWIFKTVDKEEIINTETNTTMIIKKADYEPYTWSADTIGILQSKKVEPIYGFDKDIKVVSPTSGVVISKTDKGKNELGQIVPGSITIEVRESGDENADGMRVVLVGIELENLTVGSRISKGEAIGKTGTENIKIMVLTKNDHNQVQHISEFIRPPYENYQPEATK